MSVYVWVCVCVRWERGESSVLRVCIWKVM